jgi:hypothetical protein
MNVKDQHVLVIGTQMPWIEAILVELGASKVTTLGIKSLISVRLGSVAGPVIQAAGRSEFEDGLGSCDFVSGYSYHMGVRTRLSDHTKQTKF